MKQMLNADTHLNLDVVGTLFDVPGYQVIVLIRGSPHAVYAEFQAFFETLVYGQMTFSALSFL